MVETNEVWQGEGEGEEEQKILCGEKRDRVCSVAQGG